MLNLFNHEKQRNVAKSVNITIKNASHLTPSQTEALTLLAKLPIRFELRTHLENRLLNHESFSRLIIDSSDYFCAYHQTKGTGDLTANSLLLELLTFYLVSSIKKVYLDNPKNEYDFLATLENCLGFLCELATEMHENKRIPTDYNSSSHADNIYARFFAGSYDAKLFENQAEFNRYQLAFSFAKIFLNLQQNNDGNIHFSFQNEDVFNYLIALNPCALLEGKNKLIAEFIDKNATSLYELKQNEISLQNKTFR